MLNWRTLDSKNSLEEILEISKSVPCAIFKHSTRCSTSSVAKNRLERGWNHADDSFPVYYLDVLESREVSSDVAAKFDVIHQSPQLLVIKNGDCVYHASHLSISIDEVNRVLSIETPQKTETAVKSNFFNKLAGVFSK
jgi:bacillithiol system protein YtxJ